MPKIIPAITDTQIRTCKPREKDYKLYDSGGLRLLVRKTGTKVWQFPYKYKGTANIYTIGKYPLISLAEARQKRDMVKRMLLDGVNPALHKKAERAEQHPDANSFESIAREWHSKQLWDKKHSQNIIMTLEKDVFPSIGSKHISEVV